jgi:hypothetical protein
MTSERRAELAYWAAVAIGVVFIFVAGPLARRLELVHMNDFSGVWSGVIAIVLLLWREPADEKTLVARLQEAAA